MLTSRRDDVTQPESHSGWDVKSWWFQPEVTDGSGWFDPRIREMNREKVAFVTGRLTRLPDSVRCGKFGTRVISVIQCPTVLPASLWCWLDNEECQSGLAMLKAWLFLFMSLSLARVFVNISLCFSNCHRQSQEAPMKEDGSKLQWRRCHPFSVYPALVCRVDSQSHMHIRHGYIQSYIHFDPFDPFKMSPWKKPWRKHNSS